MSNSLGWVFCELAFRTWDRLPVNANRRWWFGLVNASIAASYRLGCFFYGRAAA